MIRPAAPIRRTGARPAKASPPAAPGELQALLLCGPDRGRLLAMMSEEEMRMMRERVWEDGKFQTITDWNGGIGTYLK